MPSQPSSFLMDTKKDKSSLDESVEEEQFKDFDTFKKEAKKQLENSMIEALWKTITRTQLITIDEVLSFTRRFVNHSERVDHLVEILKTQFVDLLNNELKKVKVSDSVGNSWLTIDAEMNKKFSFGAEVKSWKPIRANLMVHAIRITIHENQLFMNLICNSDILMNEVIQLDWDFRRPNEIVTKFKSGFKSDKMRVSDNISNGLLNGIFDIYGKSDKLLEYWKKTNVSYVIKTGRRAKFVNSKFLFGSMKLQFEKALYNIENVNPERIESIVYKVDDYENCPNGRMELQKIVLSNISFYYACLLMSKFHPCSTLVLNYHNMVTNLIGITKIDLGKKLFYWTDHYSLTRFKYFYNWNENTARYDSYSKMPKFDYLPLESFGFVTPFCKPEVHLQYKAKPFASLSARYEFDEDTIQLTITQPELLYLARQIESMNVTGHFKGILGLYTNVDVLTLNKCEFFIDTILGFIQIDLSYLGLGWRKYYKFSKICKISSKCPHDISIICLG